MVGPLSRVAFLVETECEGKSGMVNVARGVGQWVMRAVAFHGPLGAGYREILLCNPLFS